MSNQTALQYPIDLTSALDMNLNKNTIRQFEGFTKRNAPYINGGLSPLYATKEIAADIITKNLKEYKLEAVSGGYKLNVANSPLFTKAIKKEVKENPVPDYNAVYIGSYTNNGVTIDKWLYIKNSEIVLSLNGIEQVISDFSPAVSIHVLNNGAGTDDVYIAVKEEGQTRFLRSNGLNVDKYSCTSQTISNYNGVVKTVSNKLVYIFNDTNINTKNVVKNVIIDTYEESYKTVRILAGNNYLSPEGDIYTFDATLTTSTTYVDLVFKKKATLSLVNEVLSISYNQNLSYRFYKTLNSIDYVYPTAVGSFADVVINNNDIILSWSIPVTLSNGKTIFFYNFLPNGQVIDEAGNMSCNIKIERDFNLDNVNIKYNLLYNSNYLSGVSVNNILLSNFLDVTYYINYPYVVDNSIIYENKNKNFVSVSFEDAKPEVKLLYDRYILINGYSAEGFTVYDIKNKEWSNYAPDWNNRIIPSIADTTFTLPDADTKYMLVGSGHNISYENSTSGLASSEFTVAQYLFYPLDEHDITSKYSELDLSGIDIPGYSIELYYNESVNTIPAYVKTNTNGKITYDAKLIGTTYPIQTEGNIILSPSICNKYIISGLMYDSIKSVDGDFYKLIYSDDLPVFLYAYGSNIKNVQDIFFIQGQLYIIRNDIIISAYIDGNSLSNTTPIINKGNLFYLGCTPLIAYFYSTTDRYIYAFSGDRNLTKVYEISEFTEIYDSLYIPDLNGLILATDNGIYVIDSNSYIFCIEGNFNAVIPLINGFAGFDVTKSKWNEYFYYNDNATKQQLELTTSFYGAGNNVVSVIDTWYIKLFSPTKEDGKIKLFIKTLTDKTTISKVQEIEITSDMWDNNGFIYIRYQPQYQRSVGASLSIISDFELFDLQASILPDDTKQLSSDYKQEVYFEEEEGI